MKKIKYVSLIFSLSLLGISLAQNGFVTNIEKEIFSVAAPETSPDFFESELAILHKYQNERTVADCELAKTHNIPFFRSLYLYKKNPRIREFTKNEIDLLSPMMKEVLEFAEKVTNKPKKLYARKRPNAIDPTLSPCIPTPSGETSYPSFHSAAGSVSSCLLAELFPENGVEFINYGIKIGLLRNIGGVHFPSDVKAGYQIGQAICQSLLKDSNFMKKFDDLKSKLK